MATDTVPEDATETTAGPLTGVRVIDLTRALAGPFATLVLAGLGADVIKVEDPQGGDIARGNAPYVGRDGLSLAAGSDDDMSLALLNRCRGKRSVTLNLKHPGSADVFADLVRDADIVVENFSAGTADRLGVGYDAAHAANARIIYCSISGFGANTDPGVLAMDTIIQALSGVMLSGGAADDPPFRVGVPVADVLTPVWAVIGMLAALQRRHRTGLGEHVDVSMLGVVTSLVATEDWAALAQLGQPLRTGPTLPRLAPFGLYRCADGWISLVAPQDKLVQRLFDAIGRPELMDDPRFATRDARVHHDAEITEEIERFTRQHSTAETTALLREALVPVAPVRSPLEAVADERVLARGETEPVRHPTLGAFPDLLTAGIPLSLGDARVGFDRLAPRLSEHTDEILGEIDGYDPARLRRLRDEGVI